MTAVQMAIKFFLQNKKLSLWCWLRKDADDDNRAWLVAKQGWPGEDAICIASVFWNKGSWQLVICVFHQPLTNRAAAAPFMLQRKSFDRDTKTSIHKRRFFSIGNIASDWPLRCCLQDHNKSELYLN